MDEKIVRICLNFDVICQKYSCITSWSKAWFCADRRKHDDIPSMLGEIRNRFISRRKCARHTLLHLYLNDVIIPDWETLDILRDNDQIVIKGKCGRHIVPPTTNIEQYLDIVPSLSDYNSNNSNRPIAMAIGSSLNICSENVWSRAAKAKRTSVCDVGNTQEDVEDKQPETDMETSDEHNQTSDDEECDKKSKELTGAIGIDDADSSGQDSNQERKNMMANNKSGTSVEAAAQEIPKRKRRRTRRKKRKVQEDMSSSKLADDTQINHVGNVPFGSEKFGANVNISESESHTRFGSSDDEDSGSGQVAEFKQPKSPSIVSHTVKDQIVSLQENGVSSPGRSSSMEQSRNCDSEPQKVSRYCAQRRSEWDRVISSLQRSSPMTKTSQESVFETTATVNKPVEISAPLLSRSTSIPGVSGHAVALNGQGPKVVKRKRQQKPGSDLGNSASLKHLKVSESPASASHLIVTIQTGRRAGVHNQAQVNNNTAGIHTNFQAADSDKISQNTVNYEEYPSLDGLPRVNDRIAYKILEMGDGYLPMISDYKVAAVQEVDIKLRRVRLQTLQSSSNKRKLGRFDCAVEDQDEILTNVDEGETDEAWKDWGSIMSPRLL